MTSTYRAYQDQADGLGYCFECAYEYSDFFVVRIPKSLDGSGVTEFCPNCNKEDRRILYYCRQLPLHNPSECETYE